MRLIKSTLISICIGFSMPHFAQAAISSVADAINQCWQAPLTPEMEQECLAYFSDEKNLKASLMGPGDQISSFGMLGPLEDEFLKALKDFIVNRAEQETKLLVQERLAEKLCPKVNEGEVKVSSYFPNTCRAVNDAAEEGISLAGYDKYLKLAGYRDLEGFPAKYWELVSSKAQHGSEKEEMGTALLMAYDAYLMSREGKNGADVIFTLAQNSEGRYRETQFLAAVKQLAVLLQGLEIKNGKMVAPPNFGGFATAAKNIPDWQTTRKIIEELVAVYALIEKDKKLDETIADIGQREAARNKLRYQAISRLLRLTVRLQHETGQQPLPEKTIKIIETINEFGKAYLGDDSRAMLFALLGGVDSGAIGEMPPAFRRYLPIIEAFAQAQSSDEILAVLENFSAPVGSYRQKAKLPFTTTLTALLGVAGAYEKVDSYSGEDPTAFGVFAPVGLHLAWSSKNNKCYRGLLISAFDLATLVSARSDDEGLEQNSTFKQVFSPGLFATQSIGKGPLLFGFGASIAPELLEEQSGEKHDVLRYQVFFAMDLTLLEF